MSQIASSPKDLWPLWKILVSAVLLIVLAAILNRSCAQCPEADMCDGAITVPSMTVTQFCNTSCSFDYYMNDDMSMPLMDNTVTTSAGTNFMCHVIDIDFWYQIEVQEGGEVCFGISSDYQANPQAMGNHGLLEGVVMLMYEGSSCSNAELIWSTNCYWMTTETYSDMGAYDPSRQEWEFSINLSPGNYFVQIDSFNWSKGCGEFYWCENFFLDAQQVDWTYAIESGQVAFHPAGEIETLEKSLFLERWESASIDHNTDHFPSHGWNYYRINGEKLMAVFYHNEPRLDPLQGFDTAGRRIR